MNVLGVKLGFGFSAGLFDYGINFGISTRPLWLIPVGLAYFAVYYVSFSWCIRRFDLKTPGRDAGEVIAPRDVGAGTRGGDFALALGGAANLKTVDACMTRLRLTLNDPDAIDEARLKALGARGLVRPGGDALQVVLGPIADQVAGEIRASLRGAPALARAPEVGPEWAQALGGEANVEDLQQRSGRLIVSLADATKVDAAALTRLGARAVVESGGGRLHILLDEPTAESVSRQLATA